MSTLPDLLRLCMLLACWLVSFTANAVVILQYHHVDTKTPPSTSIAPSLFAEHLDYIDQNGFQVWPLDKVIEHFRANNPIPDKVVAITFDDAYISVYNEAFPLLMARSYPFTVFVATEAIEQKLSTYMSWQQLAEIKTYGATIANHTHTHPHLVRRHESESEQAWLERVKFEIETAQQLILERLGDVPRFLAYPYGEYTREIETLVGKLGFTAFGQQSGAASEEMHITALPRFPMTNLFGAMPQFKLKVASLPFPAETVEPSRRIIRGDELSDGLKIRFKPPRSRVSCFFAGQAVAVKQSNAEVHIEQLPKLPVGRSRINCTAPSDQANRYYWFSHWWMKPNPDGSWYLE